MKCLAMTAALCVTLAACAQVQKTHTQRCPSNAAHAVDFVLAGAGLTGSVVVYNNRSRPEDMRLAGTALLFVTAMTVAYSSSVAGTGCP